MNATGPSALSHFRKKWCLQGSRSENEMLISWWLSFMWLDGSEQWEKKAKQKY